MKDRMKGMLMALAALAVLGVGGAAVATAAGGDDPADDGAVTSEPGDAAESEGRDDDAGEADEQVTDPQAADRASAAALEEVGEGEVTEVELADEGESGYEVEVRQPDGGFVEVSLDDGFGVVGTEADDD